MYEPYVALLNRAYTQGAQRWSMSRCIACKSAMPCERESAEDAIWQAMNEDSESAFGTEAVRVSNAA